MGNFIKVAQDNWHFCESETGKMYMPVGINYFPRGTGWAPQLWVQFDPAHYYRDFPRLKALNMNTIRVFLTLQSFMPEEMQVSQDALKKAQKMLDVAKEHGLRIIFSGPSAWEGIPEWNTAVRENHNNYFTDEKNLQNLENFYNVFSDAFKDHEGLFGIDLFNEPSIVYSPKEGIENNKELIWQYQKHRNNLSRQFVSRCVTAIKKCDKNHLVSLGSHPFTVPFSGNNPSEYFSFDPHVIGDLLDYISLHWYPYLDKDIIEGDKETFDYNMNSMLGSMKYMYVGKPVVLEEFGLYGGGAAEFKGWKKFDWLSQQTQADWVVGAMDKGKKYCGGWLNWGFDDHPDCGDPTRYQGFYDDDIKLKKIGEVFPDAVLRTYEWMSSNQHKDSVNKFKVHLKDIVTSGKDMTAMRDAVIKKMKDNPDFDFKISTY
jgi:hypothetical protein